MIHHNILPIDVTTKGQKPLDFGARGVTGSVNFDGRLVSINLYHAEHGYVTLNAVPPFQQADSFDATAVRQYRAKFRLAEGFGLHIAEPIVKRDVGLVEYAIPYTRFQLENGRWAEVYTFVSETIAGVVQLWQLSDVDIRTQWKGQMWLQRCAYTQITEGGVRKAPSAKTNIIQQDDTVTILENVNLPLAVAMNSGAIGVGEANSLVFQDETSRQRLDSLDAQTFALYFAFGETATEARQQFDALYQKGNQLLEENLRTWQGYWSGWQYADCPEDSMLRRAVVYARQSCIPMGEDATCMITDHQLLPLSWNRDSYYQAMALLSWRDDMREQIRRHLIWLFEVAERPDGAWYRAYFINGKVKDSLYQLDQHIFPLLEFADYFEATADKELFARLQDTVNQCVDDLIAREVEGLGLFQTEESPADDPLPMPYHFSSHVLLWYTLRRLAKLLNRPNFLELADRVHRAVYEYFPAVYNGQTIFSYVTDAKGEHVFYHDANDFPTVLAPIWGFCDKDDAIWRATLDYAFSEQNERGFATGELATLGSIHTPGGWSLGNVQAYIVAKILGDEQQAQAELAKQFLVSQADGALPEAFDTQTGLPVARHWFSWPESATFLYFKQLSTIED